MARRFNWPGGLTVRWTAVAAVVVMLGCNTEGTVLAIGPSYTGDAAHYWSDPDLMHGMIWLFDDQALVNFDVYTADTAGVTVTVNGTPLGGSPFPGGWMFEPAGAGADL